MGGHERDANKAVVAHFSQRGDVTVYGLGSQVIDQDNALAGTHRGIHEQKSAVGAHHAGGSH